MRTLSFLPSLAPRLPSLLAAFAVATSSAVLADEQPASNASAGEMTPVQRAESTPRGELKNPFSGQAAMEAEGRKLYMSYGCSGCHGGTGGGGMCPPINGDVWFYGIGDDVLFRLIAIGSVGMQQAGFDRLGGQGLQMPPFGTIIKTDEETWKIIAWIRTIYKGDPKKKNW